MHRRLTLTATALLAVLALTGCTGAAAETEPATSQAPAPSPTSPATPTTSEPAWPESAIAPECEDVISLDWLTTNIDPRIEGPDIFTPTSEWITGPVAQEAFDDSAFLAGCTWGIPQSDGGFYVIVMAVTPEVQEPLTEAFATSGVYDVREDEYVDSDGTKAAVYSRDLTDGIGSGYAHGFHSGYWVIVNGTLVNPDSAAEVANMALAAMVEGP